MQCVSTREHEIRVMLYSSQILCFPWPQYILRVQFAVRRAAAAPLRTRFHTAAAWTEVAPALASRMGPGRDDQALIGLGERLSHLSSAPVSHSRSFAPVSRTGESLSGIDETRMGAGHQVMRRSDEKGLMTRCRWTRVR